MKKQTKKILIIVLSLCLFASCIVAILLFTNLGGPKTKEKYYFYINDSVKTYNSGSDIVTYDDTISLDDQNFYRIPLIGEDCIMLTADSVYYPIKTYSRSRVDKQTKIYLINDEIVFRNEKNEINGDKGFLYDGRNTFILLDDTELKVNGRTTKLSALSYVYYDEYSISYFDFGTKNMAQTVIELEDIDICCNSYKISIGESLYIREGNSLLLSRSPKNYDSVFEY